MKLKFSTLTITVFAFSMHLYAQSFLSENKLYTMAYDMQVHGIAPKGFYWKFSGDTLINTITYKKSFKSETRDKSSWSLNSFWREQNGKVYRYNADPYINGGKDILTYDFNLGIKDTFLYRDIQMVLESINIVPWGFTSRRQYQFHALYNGKEIEGYKAVWIEGIGNIEDPRYAHQWMITGGYNFMVCYEENGMQIYHNPKYTSCFITSNNELSEASQNVWVNQSPNGNIRVALNKGELSGGRFILFSPEGKVIHSVRLKTDQAELCPPGTGLYLYRFETENGQVQTGKVLMK